MIIFSDVLFVDNNLVVSPVRMYSERGLYFGLVFIMQRPHTSSFP